MPTMTVRVGNGKTVKLSDQDYVGAGGEGTVYLKRGLCYKIYFNPNKKMIPLGKIRELAPLAKHPTILAPQDVLYKGSNGSDPIGFTMKFASDTVPLAQTFSNGFRKREKMTPDMALELVKQLEELIAKVHEENCLIVDMNEFNFLVKRTLVDVCAIDVDCYQTPSFPATAILPAIQDFTVKNNQFTKLSDWFSFAILATQIFIGIHPFRGGKHPSCPSNDFKERQLKQISVFHKGVDLPKRARDVGLIPFDYLAWLIRLFEKGERTPPPTMITSTIIVAAIPKAKIGSNLFTIDVIWESDDDILYAGVSGGHVVAKTTTGAYLGGKKLIAHDNVELLVDSETNTPIAVTRNTHTITLTDMKTQKELRTLPIKARNHMVHGDRLYTLDGNKLLVHKFTKMGESLIPSIETAWTILPNSTKMYSGVVVMDALGKKCVYIPNGKRMHILFFKELDGYKILGARYINGVLMVSGFKDGKYDRLTYCISDETYRKSSLENAAGYQLVIDEDLGLPTELNFTVLMNGNIILVDENDQLVVSNRNNPMKRKAFRDPAINSSVTLFSEGNQAMFFDSQRVCKFTMRTK